MAELSSPQPQSLNFREWDVGYLQRQARIWLEEVLGERFNEDVNLVDLLADGEILVKVADVIRSLQLKHPDGDPPSPKSPFVDNGKHGGKYLPYSNVDSYLKVCKKLGLSSLDMFSPPDVVDKKDIRRVCLCIRILSKKAQAKHLEVPDFDDVARTASIPPGLVGNLRQSLLQSGSPLRIAEHDEETPKKVQLNEKESSVEVGDVICQAITTPLPDDLSDKQGVSVTNSDNSSSENEASSNPTESSPLSTRDTSCTPTNIDHNGWSPVSNMETSSPFEDDGGKDVPFLDMESSQNRTLDVGGLAKDSYSRSEKSFVPAGSPQSKNLEPKTALKKIVLKEKSNDKPIDVTSGVSNIGGERRVRFWIPLLVGVVGLAGTLLLTQRRDASTYKIRTGDTMSKIAERMCKNGWQELADLNPDIENPDLIYAGERLRLK